LGEDEKLITIVYTKLEVNGYDAVISTLGPARVDHRKNVMLIKKFIKA